MKKHVLLISTLATLFTSNLAMAGGTFITVGPAPTATAVPTLSGYMLIILSLLLVAVAFRTAKNKNLKGMPMMLMTSIGTAAIISASGSVKLISEASADGGNNSFILKMSTFFPEGDTLNLIGIPRFSRLNIIENDLDENKEIIRLEYDPFDDGCSFRDTPPIDGVQECKLGTVIPTTVNGMCYIDCRGPLPINNL